MRPMRGTTAVETSYGPITAEATTILHSVVPVSQDEALAAIRAETVAEAALVAEDMVPAIVAAATYLANAAPPVGPIVEVAVASEAPEVEPVADIVPVAPTSPPVVAAPSKPAVTPLAWGAKVSPEFREKVRVMCGRLGCQPDHMMAAMAFESVETFSPAVRNPVSGATGLIQFMSETARTLSTSQDRLADMTAEEQLVYVERYFQPFNGRLSTLEDVYMAILWPRAVGQANTFVLFAEGTIQYAQNSALDADKDGEITKHETAGLVTAMLRKGLRPQNAL